MSRTTLFGPPGSGKTTTLSKWAKQAAKKYGGENVMVCSLTKTAATEIQSRDTGVPRENVGTLHAHAYRAVLARDEGRVRVISDKDADEFNSGKHSIFQIPKFSASPDDQGARYAETALGRCDLLRAKRVPVERWTQQLQQFWGIYSQWKEINKLIDFTDMIDIALNEIDSPLDYIILDEAQDSSALEYALLEKWASQAKGCVIAGDDDQAAYEWRGASVHSFLSFSEDQRVLPRTYRLPHRIMEFADRWIHQIKNRKEKVYLSTDEIGQVSVLDTRSTEEVVALASSMSSRGETTMILTTCGYMLSPVIAGLLESRVSFHNPYRVVGDFASTWNPLLAGSGGRVTAADAVRSFLSPPWTFATANHWLREMSAEHLQRGTKASSKRQASSDSLISLDTLSSYVGEEFLERALKGDVSAWLKRVKDPKRRNALALRAQLLTSGSSQSPPMVVVGTIHSVKGGQADNVILYPDLSPQGKESWLNYPDAIIRQMYIGMTRARKRLYLVPGRGPVQW